GEHEDSPASVGVTARGNRQLNGLARRRSGAHRAEVEGELLGRGRGTDGDHVRSRDVDEIGQCCQRQQRGQNSDQGAPEYAAFYETVLHLWNTSSPDVARPKQRGLLVACGPPVVACRLTACCGD